VLLTSSFRLRPAIAAGVVLAALLGGAPAAVAAQTIVVSSTAPTLGAGDGCTLRDALTLAGAQSNPALPKITEAGAECAGQVSGAGAPATVQLQAGEVYTLSEPDNWWFGPNGLPSISSAITIEGNGATIARSTAAGTPPFRLFYISGGLSGIPAGNLTLRKVAVTGGLAKGGDSDLGGGGAGMGGAIFTQGTLTLDRATLSGNMARGGAHGRHSEPDDPVYIGDGGGGIGEDAPSEHTAEGGPQNGGGFGGPAPGAAMGPSVRNLSDRLGQRTGGGGFRAQDGPRQILADCFVCGGGGLGGFGGGLDNPGDGGRGGLTTSSAGQGGGGGQGGQAASGGGGVGGGGAGRLFNGDSGFAGGSGGFGGGGGAGQQGQGDGGFGGGGAGTGSSYGYGSYGGGGYGGGAGTDAIGEGGGGAGMGGAIFSLFGTVTISTSTIAANTAAAGAGGVGAKGLGGAVFNVDGTVAITASTIAQNTSEGAEPHGGVYSVAYGNTITAGTATSASVTMTRSILYGNTGSNLTLDKVDGLQTNTSTATMTAPTIVGSSTVTAGATMTGTAISSDPQLAAPAHNGGTILTVRPGVGGSAYRATTACTGTDQVGNPRHTPSCELGALELTTVPPTAATGDVTGLTKNTATLGGTVNPGGAITGASFQLTTDPGHAPASIFEIPYRDLGGGTTAAAASLTARGLIPFTTYDYRLVASNSGGRTLGDWKTFTTLKPPLPTATATGSQFEWTDSAELGGTINPGGAETTFVFELSTDPAFGTSTTTETWSVGSGEKTVEFNRIVDGLADGTDYYYRVVATNSGGTTRSTAQKFTTKWNGPAAKLLPITDLKSTSVTLNGTVNPHGVGSVYLFAYAPAGGTLAPVSVELTNDETTPLPVSAKLTGLKPGTDYVFLLKIINQDGEDTTPIGVFKTPANDDPVPGGGTTNPPGGGGGLTVVPLPGNSGGTTPAALAPPTVTASGSLVITAGAVRDGYALKCAAGGPACKAKIVVTVPAPKTKGKKRKPIVIATATIALPAGRPTPLTFKLNATGRKLLKAKRRLTATVAITITSAGSVQLVTRHRAVLRAPKRRR